jgi:Holliday junction resolvasome RuvABC endonuclease subunit
LTGFFAAARDELGHPDAVAVESPGGRHIHPQLQYIVGVTLAVLAAVFEAPVVMLPPATWKTRTLGRGDASKEQIRLWARRSGYVGVVQDECDALGVAVACRVLRGSGSSVAAQNTLAVG